MSGCDQLLLSTVSLTGVSPENPSARAAAGVTSITLPRINGPRSLIRTTTERPLRRLMICTWVPNGSVRWAPVRLALQLRFLRSSESIGHHDSEIVDDGYFDRDDAGALGVRSEEHTS